MDWNSNDKYLFKYFSCWNYVTIIMIINLNKSWWQVKSIYRATLVLGFLPQELLGTSMYEYYHHDDIPHLAESHKAALQASESVSTQVSYHVTHRHSFAMIMIIILNFNSRYSINWVNVVSTVHAFSIYFEPLNCLSLRFLKMFPILNEKVYLICSCNL